MTSPVETEMISPKDFALRSAKDGGHARPRYTAAEAQTGGMERRVERRGERVERRYERRGEARHAAKQPAQGRALHKARLHKARLHKASPGAKAVVA